MSTVPRTASAYWIVAMLSLAGVLSYADRYAVNVLVDAIRGDLGISDFQISLIQGLAFAVFYACAGLPLGRAADILPRRNLIIAGIVLWSAATMAGGFARSFGELFASRVLVGIGEAVLAPAAISIIADVLPATRRAFANGIFLMGMFVGAAAATACSGYLLQAAAAGHFDAVFLLNEISPWRTVLILMGAPGIFVALLMFTWREPQRTGETQQSITYRSMSGVVAEFVRQRRVMLGIYAGVALLSMSAIATGAWGPTLLMRRYGMAPADAGLQFGAVLMVASIVGTSVTGFAADRLARRSGPHSRTLLAALVGACALASSQLYLATSAQAALVMIFVIIAAANASLTLGLTSVQERLPNSMSGIATSCMSFLNTVLGASLGPIAVALATQHLYQGPLALDAGLATVIAPAALLATCAFAFAAYSSYIRMPGSLSSPSTTPAGTNPRN